VSEQFEETYIVCAGVGSVVRMFACDALFRYNVEIRAAALRGSGVGRLRTAGELSAMKRIIAIALCSMNLGALPALAHHSLAAYTMSSYRTVDGTVKRFEWTNPHAKLTVVVPDGNGGSKEWSFEGGSIGRLTNGGWVKDAIAPGDKVKVAYNPRRDSSIGGFFIAVTTPSGKTYSIDRYKQLQGGSPTDQ
jgi:hypothetical protein